MDFHARQYDPQLGRFLGVDPRADQGGQQTLSPYAAMGNAPESMVDPNGEQFNPGLNFVQQMSAGNAGEFMGEAGGTISDMSSDPMGGGGLFSGGSNSAFNNWGYGSDRSVIASFWTKIESVARNTTGDVVNFGSAVGNFGGGGLAQGAGTFPAIATKVADNGIYSTYRWWEGDLFNMQLNYATALNDVSGNPHASEDLAQDVLDLPRISNFDTE